MDMDDVTVGIKSFFRPEKLEICLKSLDNNPHEFKEIIVADDGEINEEKRKLYEEYQEKLPLNLIELDFDYGLAASRNKIVEEMNGDYLLLLDDDMAVPGNVDLLKHILEAEDSLGGIAGVLYEDGNYKSSAQDLFLENTLFGKTLVRDIREEKEAEVETQIGRKTIYEYDFITTCALIRREALKDQKWDPEYIIEYEHLDFYWSHKQNTDWHFAITEEVTFSHYPGGSIDFEENRESKDKHKDSEEHFKCK